MTSFRTIAALTVITGACMLGALPTASAQSPRPIQVAAAPLVQSSQGFARCPRSIDQYVDTMKQLISEVSRARALADENPLLEPDAAFYEAELAATRKCAPDVAVLASSAR
ncbi:MAG TPA: hypothetical protein VGH49_18675 [Xanthobacteraceae bacterium]|jgi:hypothetical protein